LPSRRRFEGADVETLLDEVHKELGPDAQIVEANKLRKGGLGGFFARETFEIVAEPGVMPATGVVDAPAPADAPTIRMAHADRAIDDEPAGGATEAPALSTESASFAEILDRLARETIEDDDPDPDDPPAVVARPAVLRRNAPDARGAYAQPEPAALAAQDAQGARVHEWPSLEDLEARDRDAAPAPAPVLPAVPARAASGERSPLVRLGLPPALVPQPGSTRDVQVALARRLHALPAAPEIPTAPGSVIAIVGNGTDSVRVARRLASELSVDPDDVVVASQSNDERLPPWLHVADAGSAAQRRRAWWRRGRLTLVAVDNTETTDDAAWTRGVLDAIEPTLAWGVVDATRKPEDVAAWAGKLGALDAIALENIRATVSPAAILHVGIPVASIDGRRATPERWAQVLAARLAA
jgi:hypothetical protein